MAVQEARETVRRREAETAGRWGMLSEAAAVHFEAAGATLEQLSDATSALVALKQAQEECVAGWGAAAEAAAQGLRDQGAAAAAAAPDGEALAAARDKAAAALQAATEPVVEALEGVLQKQEVLQVRSCERHLDALGLCVAMIMLQRQAGRTAGTAYKNRIRPFSTTHPSHSRHPRPVCMALEVVCLRRKGKYNPVCVLSSPEQVGRRRRGAGATDAAAGPCEGAAGGAQPRARARGGAGAEGPGRGGRRRRRRLARRQRGFGPA